MKKLVLFVLMYALFIGCSGNRARSPIAQEIKYDSAESDRAECAIANETIAKFHESEAIQAKIKAENREKAYRNVLLGEYFWKNCYITDLKQTTDKRVWPHLRKATIEDYEKWLCGYIQKNPGTIDNFVSDGKNIGDYFGYSYKEKGDSWQYHGTRTFIFTGFFVATSDFIMPPSVHRVGNNWIDSDKETIDMSFNVIVPKEIKVERVDNLGENRLFYEDGYRVEGGAEKIPIFKDIDFSSKNFTNK